MNPQSQASRAKRPRPPLDLPTIRALALHYVGRYATTRARLKRYLERKLRERGWVESAAGPDIDAMISDFSRLGYVDDTAFATARTHSLLQRGYGENRLNAALRQAGIGAEDAQLAARLEPELAREAAMTFARRKRLGPFGPPLPDRKAVSRAFAAFARAGHSYEIAREILQLDQERDKSAEFSG